MSTELTSSVLDALFKLVVWARSTGSGEHHSNCLRLLARLAAEECHSVRTLPLPTPWVVRETQKVCSRDWGLSRTLSRHAAWYVFTHYVSPSDTYFHENCEHVAVLAPISVVNDPANQDDVIDNPYLTDGQSVFGLDDVCMMPVEDSTYHDIRSTYAVVGSCRLVSGTLLRTPSAAMNVAHRYIAAVHRLFSAAHPYIAHGPPPPKAPALVLRALADIANSASAIDGIIPMLHEAGVVEIAAMPTKRTTSEHEFDGFVFDEVTDGNLLACV
jgi:hypothetical protein